MDDIILSQVPTQCIIGIHPVERMTPQPLVSDLIVRTRLKPAAYSSSITDVIDYTHLAQVIEFVLVAGRFFMLETAAEAVVNAVSAIIPKHFGPLSLELSLKKPLALLGKGSAMITIRRDLHELALGPWQEAPKFRHRIIFSHLDFELQQVELEPESEARLCDRPGPLSVWTPSLGLTLQGQAVPQGKLCHVPEAFSLNMVNKSPQCGNWLVAASVPSNIFGTKVEPEATIR